eukprot:CAMPEP_0167744246 /NCGR_PEP_ID=MMETSP0110_2-20121227/2481_1 /TAXON_ID=629695 /ORGANISM="Gymnochlora sp., Strain CCMP2014" /LENGTH=168 /DNA_ID=CAMNT_0007628739 /DNA_START=444 /DNA_END=948 /DNA_ORIENTATION=+
MPMRLDEGWNQIQFNLSDFTRRAYGTNYIETLRVQIHANCRIRRIYFSDRLYTESELPPEFKLYLPVQQQQQKENVSVAICRGELTRDVEIYTGAQAHLCTRMCTYLVSIKRGEGLNGATVALVLRMWTHGWEQDSMIVNKPPTPTHNKSEGRGAIPCHAVTHLDDST